MRARTRAHAPVRSRCSWGLLSDARGDTEAPLSITWLNPSASARKWKLREWSCSREIRLLAKNKWISAEQIRCCMF